MAVPINIVDFNRMARWVEMDVDALNMNDQMWEEHVRTRLGHIRTNMFRTSVVVGHGNLGSGYATTHFNPHEHEGEAAPYLGAVGGQPLMAADGDQEMEQADHDLIESQ